MAKRGQSKYMPHLRAKLAPKPQPYVGDTARQHDAMIVKAKTNTAKGQRGGDCNRTACQRPASWWYNRTMQAYYCDHCADLINESCLHRDHVMSNMDIYVKPPAAWIDAEVGGIWNLHVTTADGTETIEQTFHNGHDADDGLMRFYHKAGLRGDGSPPFHYSELPEKMERLKKRIEELDASKHSVPSEEHSVGLAPK